MILDDHSNDTTTPECPNSIILAKTDDAPPATKVDSLSKIEPQVNPPDRTNSLQSEEPLVNFFIYEIVDFSDEAPSNQQTSRTPGNDNNPLLRRSFRNVGPPKFYGKKYFMDVIDQFHETSGSASNPIVWDNISYNEDPGNRSSWPIWIKTSRQGFKFSRIIPPEDIHFVLRSQPLIQNT